MIVKFFSDSSYVDRGFNAEFEAIDMADRRFFTGLTEHFCLQKCCSHFNVIIHSLSKPVPVQNSDLHKV